MPLPANNLFFIFLLRQHFCCRNTDQLFRRHVNSPVKKKINNLFYSNMAHRYRQLLAGLTALIGGYAIGVYDNNSKLPKRPPAEKQESALVPLPEVQRELPATSLNVASSDGDSRKVGELLSILKASGGNLQNIDLIHAVLRALGRLDPSAAIQMAQAYELKGMSRCVLSALEGWAESAPGPALDWAGSQINGKSHPYFYTFADYLLSQGQFQMVATKVMQRSADDVKVSVAGRLAAVWSQSDAPGFARWLASVPQSEAARPGMVTAFLQEVASTDLDLAMDFALHNTNPGYERKASIETVTAQMIKQGKLNDAEAWVNNIKDPSLASSAYSQLATATASSDVNKAMSWVSRISPGEEKDSALAQVAVAAYPDNLLEQFKIAETIGGKMRRPMLNVIVRKWAAEDSASAARYLQNSQNLRPEDRKALLKLIEKS